MIVNTFTGKTSALYAAFDFETHTFVDGKILPEEELRRMCGEIDETGKPVYSQSWWREHTTVECWAWIIYTPDGFAIAESFEEWLYVIQKAHIKTGWFYNAPFDFSILDYRMLSDGWEYVEKAKEARQYSELANDYGVRYSMTICAPYTKEKGDRSKRTKWKFTCYDLKNILHGGLRQLLQDFDVRDDDGNQIRKTEMEYQSADGRSDAEIEYMKNDAAGLWWLIDKAGQIMETRYGQIIRGQNPEILTAAGLAKRVFLNAMYPESRTKWFAAWKFRHDHPIDMAKDEYFRSHGLLNGGLVVVNPRYAKKTLTGVKMHRYDVNSEYPAYMHDMRSVYGFPYVYKTPREAAEWHDQTEACFIYEFDVLRARIKDGALPCWRDPFTMKITDEITITPITNSVMMFREEFEELLYWYDVFDMNISRVIVYNTRKEKAIEQTIDREYTGKQEARANKEKGLESFHKIILNGFSGKYSQNPRRSKSRRVLTDNHVSYEEFGTEEDPKSLMQVVQGSRITANGRCMLRRYARIACGGVENTARLWVYADTDSLHLLCEAPPEIIDKNKLGFMKHENETPIVEACFLAPKTYYEKEESGAIEIHAKGVRKESIKELIANGTKISDIYQAGFRVASLSALNVRGGKALLPFYKQITGEEGIPVYTELYQ